VNLLLAVSNRLLLASKYVDAEGQVLPIWAKYVKMSFRTVTHRPVSHVFSKAKVC